MERAGFILSLLVLSVTPALTDDGGIAVVGGAVHMLGEHSDVRMISAKISADVHMEDTKVRCEYLLKNEGKGRMVTLGFPDMPGRKGGSIAIYDLHLSQFRSWVDGKRLSVKLHTVSRGKGSGFDRWYVRRIWFGPGQTRQVVNTYIQPHGMDTSGARWFPYTIWPAGSWKGPIGKLDITVRWREPYLWNQTPRSKEYPLQVSEGGRELKWSWVELEPTRKHVAGLSVNFYPAWPQAVINGEKNWGPEGSNWFLVYSDLTMAPVRHLASLLGLNCVWADGVVALSDGAGKTFVCQVDSQKAIVNNKSISLQKAPVLRTVPGYTGGQPHMYAPLRPICEAFGWHCSLDYENSAVTFEQPDREQPTILPGSP